MISANVFAQSKSYYPNGKLITFEYKTINDIKRQLNVPEIEVYNHPLGEVIFRKFTKIPVAILFWGTKAHPEKIPAMIAAYAPKYKDYLYSSSYYFDLRDMMRDSTLTQDFINQTFGKPSDVSIDDGDSTVYFAKFNSILKYTDGKLSGVDVYNPSAANKHKTQILNYEVTGEDYTIGFNITLHNFDKRTIKYAYITVTATNPVRDLVAKKTVTAVGPIEEDNSGVYKFDDIVYSKTAHYLKINSIRILYMDGTQRIIPQSDIHDITYYDWEEELNRPIE